DSGVAAQLQLIQDALQAYPAMNVIWGTAPTAEAAIGAVAEAGRSDLKIVSSYE
ncbi:MAG TPA: TMAO reductase system periplasmic protein TorT, partial [Bradyrhizobium sp.]|nr:TMAO reductase system periplasmic protein TorT [Bradyrhizobium sp.]